MTSPVPTPCNVADCGQHLRRAAAGPTVSFVVPCYRLAHYLEECVGSILAQDYSDLEVLILDDASPDDTPAVAQRIVAGDASGRVSYRRNARNLGNIGTYNLGISAAQGRYVWILSPDDRLRDPAIVRRYVGKLDADPDIGFAFCPAHTLENGVDLGIRAGSLYADHDTVLEGEWLAREIISNQREILAPSVMVRKSCYERISMFPEDLPHRGDTYVWSAIAMRHKAAFFANAMVDYRVHAASMMTTLAQQSPQKVIADDLAVLWRLKSEALRLNRRRVARHCYDRIVVSYARFLLGIRFRCMEQRLSPAEFEELVRLHEPSAVRRLKLRAEVLAAVALRVAARTARAAIGHIQAVRVRRNGSRAG